jgi:hypothetical protein
MQGSDIGDFIVNVFVGMLTFAAIPAVIGTVAERAAKWHTMDPVEKNLQRVSHSCVYLLFAYAIKFGGYWSFAVDLYTYFFGFNEQSVYWINAGLIYGVCVCCVRLVTGWCAFRFFNPQFHPDIQVLRFGAVVRIAGGIGTLIYLYPKRYLYAHAGPWWALFCAATLAAAICFAVVGLARLLMLRPRNSEPPVVGPDPRDLWNWE